jgi:hypothetical protein
MNRQIEELAIPYDPSQLQTKVERRRRQVRSRVISLVITVAVLVGLYLWQRDELQGAGFFAVYGVVLAISLGWLAAVIILFVRARRDLAGLRDGVAVRIGRAGVQLGDLGAGWPEVAKLGMVKGGLGRGPSLRLDLTDGRQASVALDQVVVYPAVLDNTARAFSAGRHGVDLTALDN